MCNRYLSPSAAEIERTWHVGRSHPGRWWDEVLLPRGQGAFLRPARGGADKVLELVTGQWGLIPPFAQSPKLKYSTNNARAEELTAKPAYRGAWARGQRCIIAAASFDEPCWEGGSNQWWRFERADGMPWGLAGLWNTWTDRSTGEIHESFTMLTINADAHPLMRRMHKPDPSLPPDAQDKRSVVAIELGDVDTWLLEPTQEAQALLKPPAMGVTRAAPLPATMSQSKLV